MLGLGPPLWGCPLCAGKGRSPRPSRSDTVCTAVSATQPKPPTQLLLFSLRREASSPLRSTPHQPVLLGEKSMHPISEEPRYNLGGCPLSGCAAPSIGRRWERQAGAVACPAGTRTERASAGGGKSACGESPGMAPLEPGQEGSGKNFSGRAESLFFHWNSMQSGALATAG